MTKKFTYILFLCLILMPGLPANSQIITKIGSGELENILKNREDRLYVVNFWATWCAPCVRELPHFEKLSKVYGSDKVRFVMISLDFPSEVEEKLKPFLAKNRISLNVSLMQDMDYDKWIAKVDPQWYGNIPATLVFNNSRNIRLFHPGEFDEAGLRSIIEQNIKQ